MSLTLVGPDSRRKGKTLDIHARAFAYALRGIRLYQFLQKQKDGAAWILGKQYLRAATSIGANLEEARAAESRADFVHKLAIAQKEARESIYWLRLTAESRIVSQARLRPLMKETEELVAIVTSIIVKTKERQRARVGD